MKIGLIGRFAYECSIEKYYLRALKALGHQVVLDADSIISGTQKVNLTIVVKWCPPFFTHYCKKICPMVLIFTDQTDRFKDYFNSIQKEFKYVFLVHNEKSLIDSKRIFYLPVAYCPKEHYMYECRGCGRIVEKDIDCLFIGTMHPSRAFFKKIPSIQRFGNEWGDTRDVYGDEYRNLCSRAKIIVNHHYPGDTTNMRDYQAPNFKAMILTDKTPFIPDKDVVVYKDKKDLVNKIDYYLKHDNEREQIAKQGYKTITEGKFKYVDRMKELLKICGVG